MNKQLSRQERRRLAREKAKEMYREGGVPGNVSQEVQTPGNPNKKPLQIVTHEHLRAVIQDMQKILNYAKKLDNHIWLMVECLSEKNFLSWEDINILERKYLERETKRSERIKELLSQDLEVEDYLEEIKDDPDAPGYQKLLINPIKDLNLNPYEVGACLREINPDLKDEDYLEMGLAWGLTKEHFGIKSPKKEEKEKAPAVSG